MPLKENVQVKGGWGAVREMCWDILVKKSFNIEDTRVCVAPLPLFSLGFYSVVGFRLKGKG